MHFARTSARTFSPSIPGNPAALQHFAALLLVVLHTLEGIPRRQGGVRMNPVPLARARVCALLPAAHCLAGRAAGLTGAPPLCHA